MPWFTWHRVPPRSPADHLPALPGQKEAIYEEIPAGGLLSPPDTPGRPLAPLATEEEGLARAPSIPSIAEEDEDGYLKPNFHRYNSGPWSQGADLIFVVVH